MTRRLLTRLRTAPSALIRDIIMGALIMGTLAMMMVVTP